MQNFKIVDKFFINQMLLSCLLKRNSHFQGQTMRMMYEIIARELKSMKLDNSHPQDYLNFYCLGNREKFPAEVSNPNNSPCDHGDMVIVQNDFRFLAHVYGVQTSNS
jgi:hypothetical protein